MPCIAQNVPKQFHPVDSNKEKLKGIQLQVKEENHSDPKTAPHSADKHASSAATGTTTISTVLFIGKDFYQVVVVGLIIIGIESCDILS